MESKKTKESWVHATRSSRSTTSRTAGDGLVAAAIAYDTMLLPEKAVIVVQASCTSTKRTQPGTGIGDYGVAVFFSDISKSWVVYDRFADRMLTLEQAFACLPVGALSSDAASILLLPLGDTAGESHTETSFSYRAYHASLQAMRFVTEGLQRTVAKLFTPVPVLDSATHLQLLPPGVLHSKAGRQAAQELAASGILGDAHAATVRNTPHLLDWSLPEAASSSTSVTRAPISGQDSNPGVDGSSGRNQGASLLLL